MDNKTIFLAHSASENTRNGQPLKEHLINTAQLAESFAAPFGREDGHMCGLYHDIGKYSAAFQRRLNGSSEQVDHSTAGALLMYQKRNLPAAICIAGHHAGLPDCGTRNDLIGTFMARINRALAGEIEDCSAWKAEIKEPEMAIPKKKSNLGNYFYVKMLFSALTDADWLDTEAYFNDSELYIPESPFPFEILKKKLDEHIKPWMNPASELNKNRCQILKSCIENGKKQKGIYSFTSPTGSGKTVSSMAFAMNHAEEHGLQRIIYVIPYCSILEQTQQVFEGIFGPEVITAHYSGAEFEPNGDTADKRVFATENWEAPIILTTAVQFFESLFSNKPGKNRKLHNIANSVIIFDEAQMLPVPFLQPCVAAICELVKNYGCSAVLCTATQPALQPILGKYMPGVDMEELCPQPQKMYEAFRRVRYEYDDLLLDDDLAEQLKSKDQVLCVVNKRKHAQALLEKLGEEDGHFCLTTMLPPADRKKAIAEIRERLNSGATCRVVSTSLIEAGVDVDFPAVYRELAGLDSIIQSGGRCNREGKRSREDSVVHIFQSDWGYPKQLEQNIAAAMKALQSHAEADSPKTVHDYFDFLLYTLKDDTQLDLQKVMCDIEKLKFETIAGHFHLIEDSGFTIYIPIGEGDLLVQELMRNGPNRGLMRQLSQYAVGVYQNFFNDLLDSGAISLITQNTAVLNDMSLYSDKTGLTLDANNAFGQALMI